MWIVYERYHSTINSVNGPFADRNAALKTAEDLATQNPGTTYMLAEEDEEVYAEPKLLYKKVR